MSSRSERGHDERAQKPRKTNTASLSLAMRLAHLHVLTQHSWPRFSGEYIPVFIHRAELRPASGSRLRVAALVENKVLDPTIESVSDSDPLLEPRVVDIVRLRVEHINKVFVIYGEGDPTRHSELMPGR